MLFLLSYSLFLIIVVSNIIGYGTRYFILIPILSSLSILPSSLTTPCLWASFWASIVAITRPRSPTYPVSKSTRFIFTSGITVFLSFIVIIMMILDKSYSLSMNSLTIFAILLTCLYNLSETSYSNAGPFYSVGRRTIVSQVSISIIYRMFIYEIYNR